MSKIGVATVYTGYNYGSALQAYATKCILFEMDTLNGACYDCIARSTVDKTDIRIGDEYHGRFGGRDFK